MSIQNCSQQTLASTQRRVQSGIHKVTLIFCIFTTALLLSLAFAMSQIGHSPWGLTGAAILVVVLTVQQMLRKPSTTVTASCALKASGGAA